MRLFTCPHDCYHTVTKIGGKDHVWHGTAVPNAAATSGDYMQIIYVIFTEMTQPKDPGICLLHEIVLG